MVDFDCKTQMPSPTGRSNRSSPSLKLSPPSPKLQLPAPFRPSSTKLSPTSESACTAYDQYLRLNELRSLWSSTTTPDWKTEPLLKPSLQALEITFRFISTVLSDPRPYSNHTEWTRRLESLVTKQLNIIARICEQDDDDDTAPIFNINSSNGVLARHSGSSAEVWKMTESDSAAATATTTVVVSHVSESSLLPRLASWGKAQRLATKILYAIEHAMIDSPYTLGLGEPNLSGKPTLDYDAVCKPSHLHALLKKPPTTTGSGGGAGGVDNHENHTVYSLHQILECWVQVSNQLLLTRIENRIASSSSEFDLAAAASDCWMLEETWTLLEDIVRLHLLSDPNDFLRVKAELGLGGGCGSSTCDIPFCFRSKGLVEVTKKSKDLKHMVPEILGVEVDPMGGPVIQEATMKLYKKEEENKNGEKIHLLQGFQAVEAAVKRFYFGYKQLLVVVMGSLLGENGNGGDELAQVFLEPTYYPSLDAAKTFLGGFWEREVAVSRDGGRKCTGVDGGCKR